MGSEVEPPHKKKETNQSPSLLSLPDDIIVNCLARISKSYYPRLSLVCRSFSSHILSMELYLARLHLGTHENVLHVSLKLPNRLLPSWFSLWVKPGQTLTNDLGKKKNISTRNTLLVPIPSSYSPRVPMFIGEVGSELYAIRKHNTPSSLMWVRGKSASYAWHKAPSMKVARANAFACVLDGKIYVMGGCEADESTNWAEVFDTTTQTWESLLDPGADLRLSSMEKMEVVQGKIFVKTATNTMDYTYDPKEDKWDVNTLGIESKCEIDNVWYRCGRKSCLWYDTKSEEWRFVKGLSTFNNYRRFDFNEMANYGGKLLILWEKYVVPYRCGKKNIWCAVIAVKRYNDDEVRGKVEWASIVLRVPSSSAFLRCEMKPV